MSLMKLFVRKVDVVFFLSMLTKAVVIIGHYVGERIRDIPAINNLFCFLTFISQLKRARL
jgi:hypothetical protein